MRSNKLPRLIMMTFLMGCFLISNNVAAITIYQQYDSALNKFNRQEFVSAEKQVDLALSQYDEQKKEDKAWLAKTALLSAKIKVALARKDHKDKKDICAFFNKAHALYVELEEGEDVLNNKLADVVHEHTTYLLSLPKNKRDTEDEKYIAALADHIKLPMSDMWNVKLALIQAHLEEEASNNDHARKTLLSIVDKMPAGTAEKAAVQARIGAFYLNDRELNKASTFYRLAYDIYSNIRDAKHAGHMSYLLQDIESYRGDYKAVVKHADKAIIWVVTNEMDQDRREKAADDEKAKAEDIVIAEAELGTHQKVVSKLPVYINKGRALLTMKQFDEAVESFREVENALDAKTRKLKLALNGNAMQKAKTLMDAKAPADSAESKEMAFLYAYKIKALVGRAEAEMQDNISTARDTLTLATTCLDRMFAGKKHAKQPFFRGLIDIAQWKVALHETEKNKGNFKALNLAADYHLPLTELSTLLNKNQKDLAVAHLLWKCHDLTAKLKIAQEKKVEDDKCPTAKALKLATDKGFLHFAGLSHEQSGLLIDRKLKAKKAVIQKLSDTKDNDDKARTARLQAIKAGEDAVEALNKKLDNHLEKADKLLLECKVKVPGKVYGFSRIDQ